MTTDESYSRHKALKSSVCGPSCTHQKLDLTHAEGVGAADVISQPSRRRYDHMWLVGQFQGLAYHVCQQHNSDNVRKKR